MERDIISAIKKKEVQLSKLEAHIYKSRVCSDLYNQMLIEKAVLVKQLKDLKENSLVNKVRHLIPKKEKLICDYFK